MLKPGERISETLLARRFGISRGPLREALSRLEGRKLVQRVANQGARAVSLTLAEVMDLLVIREGLEGSACRLAAERIGPEELAQLEDLLDQHSRAEDVVSGRGYFLGGGDRDFHFRIVKASANARLVQRLSHDLYSLLRLYRYRLSMHADWPMQALSEHRAVLAALRTRPRRRCAPTSATAAPAWSPSWPGSRANAPPADGAGDAACRAPMRRPSSARPSGATGHPARPHPAPADGSARPAWPDRRPG